MALVVHENIVTNYWNVELLTLFTFKYNSVLRAKFVLHTKHVNDNLLLKNNNFCFFFFFFQMLKHVQVSPHRNRSDSLSLRSSISCASSLCGSPEPPSDIIRTPSRASSYCSLNETAPQVKILGFSKAKFNI